jgi:hypothetical protein
MAAHFKRALLASAIVKIKQTRRSGRRVMEGAEGEKCGLGRPPV